MTKLIPYDLTPCREPNGWAIYFPNGDLYLDPFRLFRSTLVLPTVRRTVPEFDPITNATYHRSVFFLAAMLLDNTWRDALGIAVLLCYQHNQEVRP